jgi:hypothetical protein
LGGNNRLRKVFIAVVGVGVIIMLAGAVDVIGYQA